MRAVAFACGVVIVLVTLESVFTTLVVPRVATARLLRATTRGLSRLAVLALRRRGGYAAKDRLLGLVGPLGIMALFVVWLALLVAGFGLMSWWAAGTTLGHAMELAGSSVFTLGVLTVARGGAEAVEFVAAGAGLLVVALEIAYLPALYAAFAAREAEVTLLATRAGIPGWGPELLARAHRFLLVDDLSGLFSTWERWSAAVAESHANHPSLMWLRSPEPRRSWLTALTAVMDAAALQHALAPAVTPRQARLCLQMGTNCLRSLARALRIPYDPDPLPTAPVRLTFDEFMVGIRQLEQAGFPFERTPSEAWRHFRGWRVNYEPIVDALTDILVPPPAPWFKERSWLGVAAHPRVRNRTPDDPEGSAPRA